MALFFAVVVEQLPCQAFNETLSWYRSTVEQTIRLVKNIGFNPKCRIRFWNRNRDKTRGIDLIHAAVKLRCELLAARYRHQRFRTHPDFTDGGRLDFREHFLVRKRGAQFLQLATVGYFAVPDNYAFARTGLPVTAHCTQANLNGFEDNVPIAPAVDNGGGDAGGAAAPGTLPLNVYWCRLPRPFRASQRS